MADQPKRIFEARLFQTARVHTETFEIEAANLKEAENRAAAIAKEKGIDNPDFEYVDQTSIAESQSQEEQSSTGNPQA